MKNIEIADIFYNIVDLLEMQEKSFRSRAYEKAARILENMSEDVADIYHKGGLKALEEIPGVGSSIALKIEEYLKTDQIKSYQGLKKDLPIKVEELRAVEGLGPKKIKKLYKELGVKSLKDLERAAKSGEISQLDDFGSISEKNILKGIEFVKRSQGRFLLGQIMPLIRELYERLEKLKEVEKISLAGSIRRRKETIGDADILIASSKPEKVVDFFVNQPEVVRVWAKGSTRSSVRLKAGFDCDLRVVENSSFGSALQYFTGNRYHNIATRRIAIQKGLKLNEYGLFRDKKKIAGSSEKEIYKAIGLPFIDPELRENNGEIEAALENKLPQLIKYDSLKGDCHCHSNWSDGAASIEEMAQAAQKMGYEYLAITDHTRGLSVAHGLNEDDLKRQGEEIDKLNQKLKNFKILKGCEANIGLDGSIDINQEILKDLDLVIASIHSGMRRSAEEMTNRLIKTMENPYIDIIGHPTGRVIFQREGYTFDWSKVLEKAKENHIALEVNSYYERLDLKDTDIKKAIEVGVKLVIDTDSHYPENLSFIEYGLAMARRGWAQEKDVLNTLSKDKLLQYFKK